MTSFTDSLTPDFIRFLFSSKPKFDCYFKVGNETQGKPERIGAVKLMLMAHSEVFKAELEDSVLKEKHDVPIKDINPETFKGMLRYVYGNDTTAGMSFDDADNLLYVAEKYMMKTFKDKLALRLMRLLNTDNICSLLNNPACHRHLELNSAITDILRHETDRVLASPQFLWMNADGFVSILEQDGLAATELELWRAAITWAKHRADSGDGQQLRRQLTGLTQHLRPCALTVDEICGEIADAQVLTKEEIGTVCLSVCRKEKPQDLDSFSNETDPRILLPKTLNQRGELGLAYLTETYLTKRWEYNFTLLTKRNSIELLPLVCTSDDINSNPEDQTYKVDCTAIITKIVNPDTPQSFPSFNPPTVVTFSEIVKCGSEFDIPLAVDGRNITLQPDTKYKVMIALNGRHRLWYSDDSGSYDNDHLSLDLHLSTDEDYEFPSKKLQYRVITRFPKVEGRKAAAPHSARTGAHPRTAIRGSISRVRGRGGENN